LIQQRDRLKAAFDNARFSNVIDITLADKAKERIRQNNNVLAFA